MLLEWRSIGKGGAVFIGSVVGGMVLGGHFLCLSSGVFVCDESEIQRESSAFVSSPAGKYKIRRCGNCFVDCSIEKRNVLKWEFVEPFFSLGWQAFGEGEIGAITITISTFHPPIAVVWV